jgi:hypothetical protein
MLTKEEILEKNGFDFEAFKLDNEYSAKSILTSMEEYASQDKWIRCTDELPPIDEADNWNKVHEVSITVFTYSDFGMRKGTYYRLSECWTVENVTGEIKVTHWMPLPQKPKQ